MFFLHILILYHLLEEVIFTLYYLYTTTKGRIAWEYASLPIQLPVGGIQGFNRIGGINHRSDRR